MKVTLKDIAREAGYSISTVSRVLNGSGTISTEVQRKVLKIAERLNYPFAKSKIPMYSNGSLHVALVTTFIDSGFYASLFSGFSKAARQADIKLSLIDVIDHRDHLIETINDLDEQVIDGICLFMPEMNKEDYDYMLANINSSLPIISNAMIQSPVVPTITFDGYSGGHLAADYLMRKQFESYGIVKGPFFKAESRFRYNGFKDYLEVCGKQIAWETEGDFTFKSGVKAYEEFKKLKKKPRSLFICGDVMCNGFIEAAKYDGVKIPEDVAIITYDNTPACVQIFPQLTSIDTNFVDLGLESFKVLKDIISKKHISNNTLNLIPVSLAERDSC